MYRSLHLETDQVKWRVSKINQVKEHVSKNDQLQCISSIAVDRFFLVCFLFFVVVFQINAFTWSIFETSICIRSNFHWRDRYIRIFEKYNEQNLCRIARALNLARVK